MDVLALQARLQEAIRYQPLVEQVTRTRPSGADRGLRGRASRTRAEFGVEFDITPYAQHAIATRLACERPHGQVARQWFAARWLHPGVFAAGRSAGEPVASGRPICSTGARGTDWLQADEQEFTSICKKPSRGTPGRT